MRYLQVLFLFFITVLNLHAASIDIHTNMENGNSVFYLQAAAFNQEQNAIQYQKKLASELGQPVRIKKDKNLYLVQVGPIQDYPKARELQSLLMNKAETASESQKAETKNNAGLQTAAAAPATDEKKSLSNDIKPVKAPSKKLWNLRSADIRAVIAEVSRLTGKNFVIDPRVQGKISIVSSTPISDKELYQVFLSVLQVSGYAALPSGDVVKIIPNIDAKTQSPDLLNDMRNPPKGDAMLVEVVPVHYVPAEQLVPVLRPLMPQWSSVSAYGPSNMLILSGRANNIHKLAEIIQQVDSSSANGIDMVPLHHVLAMDIVNTLKDIVKPQPGSGIHSQLTLAADDRSNSVLVSGSKTERIRIRLLISQLDKGNHTGTNSTTQVVYLNYMRAEDLAPILAGVAQANFSGNVGTTIGTITRPELDSTNPASNLVGSNTNSGSGSSGYGNNSASTTGMPPGFSANSAATGNTSGSNNQTEGSTKPTVQIIAEPNTNSIIINAPVSVIRILKSVISQLDIRPAQILIEALVAEVDEQCMIDLGIEWGSNVTDPDKNTKLFRPGFAILNSKTSLDDFQAQIYALAETQRANILSTPSVVVLDNRQAKILVGKQVSVASTTYPNNAGGTTTASPYTTFDRVNVALHLYVRPQITRGRGIQMQIDQGNDTIDPATGLNTLNPTFKISSIVTSVHVESGDIVVLGGLAQDSLGNNDNRLPILGDIPGVGKLFQRNRTNREKRILLVFIKPVILRTPNDAVHVSDRKYDDIRQYQLAYMRSQSYNPTNEYSVLPPLKTKKLPRPFSAPAAATK